MSSYFDEHNFDGENQDLDLLLLARMFMRNEGIIESDHLGSDIVDVMKAPPASKKVVDELPRKETKNARELSCPVCLQKYESSEKYIELPCTHKYHEDCILAWLKKTNSCPVCRYELPTDNPEYEELRSEKEREKQRPFRVEVLHSSMFC